MVGSHNGGLHTVRKLDQPVPGNSLLLMWRSTLVSSADLPERERSRLRQSHSFMSTAGIPGTNTSTHSLVTNAAAGRTAGGGAVSRCCYCCYLRRLDTRHGRRLSNTVLFGGCVLHVCAAAVFFSMLDEILHLYVSSSSSSQQASSSTVNTTDCHLWLSSRQTTTAFDYFIALLTSCD